MSDRRVTLGSAIPGSPERPARQLLNSAANYLAAASYLLNGAGAQHPEGPATLERADVLIGEAANILALVKRSQMLSQNLGRHVSLRAVVEKAGIWLISPDGAPVRLSMEITQNAAFVDCDEIMVVDALSALIKLACEAMDGCRERKIVIATKRSAHEVEIDMTYCGPPLGAVLEKESAFERREGSGASTVRTMVERLGGRLSAAYKADGAITVQLFLPSPI